MIKPKQQATRQQIARTKSTPAPIGGLNARDALALMDPQDAVTLDNFFPTPTTVNLRNGYVNWVTGISASVESLMPYVNGTGSKLIGASGTAFYDFTSTGAVGAAVVSGLTNARWQHTNIGTPGGQYLYCVNGSDDPRLFDGTSWQSVNSGSSPISITGVTTNLLIHVNTYRNRLFFIEKNSFRVWYLPVNSVGGAASSLDLSPIFNMGGYLMAMATWTIDNAAGINEYAVFISSEGEVVIYLGTDPSTASGFVLQAHFRIGHPLGRRCFTKVGSDVILLSADGVFPLSKALLTDRSQMQDALSNKILNLINTDAQSYSTNFGWEACLYPTGNKLIINVPQTVNSTQYQYVMNQVNGSWCRFTNWNANCFAVMGDVLYFGGNLGALANSAYVAKADVGFSDNGAYITGEAKTAFQYFDAPSVQKQITMVRPIFKTSGIVGAALGIDVDFEDKFPAGTPTFSGTSGTAWNTAPWNTFPWGDVSAIKKDWQGVNGIGSAISLHMRVVNNISALQWQSVDYLIEDGGVL